MTSGPGPPEIGRPAPAFVLGDQHGVPWRLADMSGMTVVVLFFPWAFTDVCSSELGEVAADLGRFQNDAVQVLAVSCDSPYALRVYDQQAGLGFPLLSDYWPHGAVASAYGVLDERRGCAQRGTFVVDGAGVLRWSDVTPMGRARDLADVRAALDELGGGRR
ncbi:MAG TPA: redoxin domain-containing protein [Jiangellales bacterium]|nr:redoxin domain-containing protein [Jiangellales bacterium]